MDTEDLEGKLEFMLSKDMRRAASALKPDDVRYLVDLYYQLQLHRISSANAVRSAEGEPNALLAWYAEKMRKLESQIPPTMKIYAADRRDGRWLLSVHGIGPVLAAGLLAHFDITKAETAGHFWSFAGYNPEMVWKKGERRPFSARVKVLCWKCGESFKKLRGKMEDAGGNLKTGDALKRAIAASEADVYGKLYASRKDYEIMRNERGDHKGYNLRTAGKTTVVDKLPPFIIEARAKRWAVKLFLAHLHHVMYEVHLGKRPPKPYILTRGDHAHFMGPPGWPCQ